MIGFAFILKGDDNVKSRWVIIIVLGLTISLLSACDLEEVLDQIINGSGENSNQQQVEDNTNINGNDTNNEENEEGNDHVDGQEAFSDNNSDLPFDEKLISEGYSLTTLPNGFELAIPYHWIMVEHNLSDGATSTGIPGFEGKFCYDLPLEPAEVAGVLESLNNTDFQQGSGNGNILHTTTFDNFYGLEGTMEYHLDEFENSCVNVGYYYIGAEAQTGDSGESVAIPSFNDTNRYINEDRTRSVPNDYETDFFDRIESAYDVADMGVDSDEIESIREKISNHEFEMTHINSGYPKIFPYEWYLMALDDDPQNSKWSGTFCTDETMADSILKFHSLLEAHNADILQYETNGSPSMNQKSNVEFAFNDEFGTGSWTGKTIFYIDRLNEFQTHKCMKVDMNFSTDILD